VRSSQKYILVVSKNVAAVVHLRDNIFKNISKNDKNVDHVLVLLTLDPERPERFDMRCTSGRWLSYGHMEGCVIIELLF
jgi:hypothetical protein